MGCFQLSRRPQRRCSLPHVLVLVDDCVPWRQAGLSQAPARSQPLYDKGALLTRPSCPTDKFKIEQQKPVYKKRAELAAKVKDFWFTALQHCGTTSQFIDAVDEEALKALKDVWIEHSTSDVREYEIRFTFGKNPFFKNSTLVKKLTLTPPADLADKADKPKPFDLEAPVYLADKVTIDWISPDHDLTKKSPRAHADDKEEFDEFEGAGSFFNWFGEVGEDRTSLGENLLEWWAHATECVHPFFLSVSLAPLSSSSAC